MIPQPINLPKPSAWDAAWDAAEAHTESTSAELRRVKAELGSAIAELNRLRDRPRLPVTDDEVRRWYAERDLNMSCGPAVLFAALRRDFNQDQGATDG